MFPPADATLPDLIVSALSVYGFAVDWTFTACPVVVGNVNVVKPFTCKRSQNVTTVSKLRFVDHPHRQVACDRTVTSHCQSTVWSCYKHAPIPTHTEICGTTRRRFDKTAKISYTGNAEQATVHPEMHTSTHLKSTSPGLSVSTFRSDAVYEALCGWTHNGACVFEGPLTSMLPSCTMSPTEKTQLK